MSDDDPAASQTVADEAEPGRSPGAEPSVAGSEAPGWPDRFWVWVAGGLALALLIWLLHATS